jgi:fatty acid amide hydrolase
MNEIMYKCLAKLFSLKNIKKLIFVSSLILACIYIRKRLKIYFLRKFYYKMVQEVIKKRKENLRLFFNNYSSNLTETDKTLISSSNLTKLLELMKEGKLTSEKIFIFFALNICTVGQELELIADVNLEEGIIAAKKCDEVYTDLRARNKLNDVPPLLGIPISIKEHIRIKGYLSTLGYQANYKNIDKNDSIIMKQLKNLGCIPLVKSNVPQGLMSFESQNNFWGNCKNPLNQLKTAGGSSGGEAGLISSLCSPIGIGTDFSGSIRLPCSFNSLYGFKPSSLRISIYGHLSSCSEDTFTGFNVFQPSWGPIGKNMEDIILICKNIFGKFEEDPLVKNNSIFNNFIFEDSRQKLQHTKIAYLLDYDFCETCDEIKDKMTKLINCLKNKAEVIEFNERMIQLMGEILNISYLILGNCEEIAKVFQGLKDEKPCNFLSPYKYAIDYPYYIRKLISFFQKIWYGERYSILNIGSKHISRKEYIASIEKLSFLKQEFYNIVKDEGIDCILMPVFPSPPFNLNEGMYFNNFNFFCIFANILDLPCCSIPLGKFSSHSNYNYSTRHNDIYSSKIKKCIAGANNLPYGIQICTFPNQDEKCLGLSREVDTIIKQIKFN